MSKSDNYLYEFGPFRLDARKRLLLRNDVPIPLRPKAFDTLLALAQNSGRVLDKDELMRTIWGDTIVEEGGLTRNISVLRKALGESPDEHRYIVTAPGRGYCFVAAVQVLEREVEDQNGSQSAGPPNIPDNLAKDPASVVVNASTDETMAATKLEPPALPAANARHSAGRMIPKWLWFGASVLGTIVLAPVIYFTHNPTNIRRDSVLLADFINMTGDEVFDGAIKQGLAIQLEQSPALNIFPDERVRENLRLMGRAPDERVTVAIGREICQRQGIKALVSGSIASLGSHYVITLEAIASQTGEPIFREQIEIERKEDALKSLGTAATRLRERLGESLSSIKRFDTPIEQATTSSLDALKTYSLGLEQANKGAYSAAVPFFQRAVELDPNFALAYQALAREQLNTDYSELVTEAANKAYQLRERTTENEKFRIVSFYHLSVTHDLEKAIEVGELWRQTYPNYWRPYHALADLFYSTGRFAKGVDAAREAIRLNPRIAAAYSNLAGSLLSLNRFEEAKEVYLQAISRKLDAPEYHYNLFWIGLISDDRRSMRREIDWFAGSSYEYGGLFLQSQAAARAGRWREAIELSDRAFEILDRRGLKGEGRGWAQMYALLSAALGDCASSRRMAAIAMSSTRRESDFSGAAVALALCGETAQAQSISDQLSQRFPKDPTISGIWIPTIRAAIELKHDQSNQGADRAIGLLKSISLDEGVAKLWPVYLRGLACLRKGAGADAITAFQKILDQQGATFWTPLYPLAQLGLARAEAINGARGRSRKAYEDLFLLWKDADPNFQFLRESKDEYNGIGF